MAPITEPCTIVYFKSKNGKCPFLAWLEQLEYGTKLLINLRLKRVEAGNWGDCKQLKQANGVWELRIKNGPGYRIYFGKVKNSIIILLCAGRKNSQPKDILLAKKLWSEYKELP